jgi:quaternary ammonium compound-resistance protein SugE
MAWIHLFLAGVFEIGWPLGFKLSQTRGNAVAWIAFSLACMALSGVLLWSAQRHIPMGTAYAVWTGIGAAGAFVVGVALFKDPASFWRIASVLCVILGIVGLKLSN